MRAGRCVQPLALAEVIRAVVRAEKAASHELTTTCANVPEARPHSYAARLETPALLSTPVGGDMRAPQNDDME